MVAPHRAVAGSLLTVAGLAFGAPLAAQTPLSSEPAAAGPIEGSIQYDVDHARQIALFKLRGARCQQLFSEFEDLDGRTLDRVLSEATETPETRLSRLSFRDGAGKPACEHAGVFAFTTPGSLTVFVCPAFRHLTRRDSKTAANLLIHEELHSLGAGEAPMPGLPTAQEITERVELRCGR